MRAKIGGFVPAWSDPDETTGGRALRHFASLRIRSRRMKGERVRQGNQIIGLNGALRNIKNKAGEGSREGAECGFKIRWDRPLAQVEFMSIEALKDELGDK